jgi:hypothetical protein
MSRRSSAASIDVEEVQTCFEQWRQNRQKRAPIPDELWAAAVEAARSDYLTECSGTAWSCRGVHRGGCHGTTGKRWLGSQRPRLRNMM